MSRMLDQKQITNLFVLFVLVSWSFWERIYDMILMTFQIAYKIIWLWAPCKMRHELSMWSLPTLSPKIVTKQSVDDQGPRVAWSVVDNIVCVSKKHSRNISHYVDLNSIMTTHMSSSTLCLDHMLLLGKKEHRTHHITDAFFICDKCVSSLRRIFLMICTSSVTHLRSLHVALHASWSGQRNYDVIVTRLWCSAVRLQYRSKSTEIPQWIWLSSVLIVMFKFVIILERVSRPPEVRGGPFRGTLFM